MPKTMLITGCSSGLGAALAIAGAKNGYKVYATMRNLGKQGPLKQAAETAGVKLEIHRLDVQDSASIAAVVSAIIAADGRIDVLVNNAGIGFVRSTEQATEKEIADLIDINQTGVIRCTKAVLPYMRKARSGRVLTVSSVGGLVGQPFNEIYCATKFALEGYMEGLACYVGPAFNIHFTIVEPGGIVSEFANTALAQIAGSGGILDDEYRPILEQYMGTVQSRQWANSPYQTAAEVADVVMDCVKSDAPPIRKRTSQWGEDLCQLKTSNDPDGKKMQAMVREKFLGTQ
jgi:NAD(P)-dependent dehydrogenase (short-subunit alcohol dehydrogenase family)